MTLLLLIMLGLIAGLLSGLIGIGGGIIIVPALVLFFHYSQKMAQGTALAILVLPIGLLAALTYYKAGNVDVKAASMIIVGFVVGALIGARLTDHVSDALLAKAFGLLLLGIGIKFLFFSK